MTRIEVIRMAAKKIKSIKLGSSTRFITKDRGTNPISKNINELIAVVKIEGYTYCRYRTENKAKERANT
jgi:hypothetical protein